VKNKQELDVEVCARIPVTLRIHISVDMDTLAEQGGDPCNSYEVRSVEPSPYNEFSTRTVHENFDQAELEELDNAVLEALRKEPKEDQL